MDYSNLEHQVARLAQKLKPLMQQNRDYGGWVSISKLAKRHEGFEDYRELIFSIKELPKYKHLFAISKNNIKLTEDGFELVSQPPKPLSMKDEAINAIRDYAATIPKIVLNVEAIKPIGDAGQKYVHAFQVQTSDETFSNGTPVGIYVSGNNSSYSGKVVGSESDGSRLYIALGSTIYPDMLPARLSIDCAYLTRQLANRWAPLEHVDDEINRLIKPLSRGEVIAHTDSAEVARMISNIPGTWKRFLWGPPGSGKTYGIAKLIGRLLQANPDERILLVAPSNLAVDVITEELLRQFNKTDLWDKLIEKRCILRYGYPKSEFVLGTSQILGSIECDELAGEAKRVSAELSRLRKEEANEQDVAIKTAELLIVQEKMTVAMSNHTKQVNVLFTTTAQCIRDSNPIIESTWDTIIVDEVTMVPPAACCFLSAIAQKRLLLAGDPRQLGPVFQQTHETTPLAKKWLGTDIFSFADLNSAINNCVNDPRLIKITAQRRCSRTIWREVEHLYPKVESISVRQAVTGISTYEAAGIIPLDCQIKNGEGNCERHQRSWQNKISAGVSISKAVTLVKRFGHTDVVIITPYRGQVKVLKELVQKAGLKEFVRVGTIHQFQGSEADIVIFDIVDDPGRNSPGILLKNKNGVRLINVAITRARKRVYLVGDLSWMQAKFTKHTNPLLCRVISNLCN